MLRKQGISGPLVTHLYFSDYFMQYWVEQQTGGHIATLSSTSPWASI
jgi:hypothetical protein